MPERCQNYRNFERTGSRRERAGEQPAAPPETQLRHISGHSSGDEVIGSAWVGWSHSRHDQKLTRASFICALHIVCQEAVRFRNRKSEYVEIPENAGDPEARDGSHT